MLGVVLCGGESRRMGADKGLLTTGGIHWAEIASQKLLSLEIPVALSLNPLQITDYISSFSKGKFIVDADVLTVRGPLLGLLSVHRQYPTEDLLVLACDMVAMQTDLLRNLVAVYQQNTEKECYVFINENEPEPLCGIYSAQLMQKVMRLLDGHELKKHSMKYIIGISDALLLPADEQFKSSFQNFNHKDDLLTLSHPAS